MLSAAIPGSRGGQSDDFDIGLMFFDTLSGIRCDGRYWEHQE